MKPEVAFHTFCPACDKWVYQFWTDGANSFCGLCRKDLGLSHQVEVKVLPKTEVQEPLAPPLELSSIPMVKRYRAKKELQDATNKKRFLWHQGDILIQNQPGSEYYRPSSTMPPDPNNPHEHCLGYPLHHNEDLWDEYYEELPPMAFKNSPTFNFYKVRCGEEIKEIEERMKAGQARLQELKEFLRE
jgi:hypothetical protein